MTMFGADFWKILKFIIAILKLMGEVLGNDEDREEIKKNGFS